MARQESLHDYVQLSDLIVIILTPDLRVHLVNSRACKLLGLVSQELLGKKWLDRFVPKSDRAQQRQLLQQLLEDQSQQELISEHSVLDGDGVEHWLLWHQTVLRDEKGEVFGILCSGTDVTESRKQEGALEDTEATLRSILDTCVDAIITIDTTGKILSANPATEKMFGYSKAQLIGNKVNILMPEPGRSQHDEYLHRYLMTGEAKIIGIGREVIASRRDGSTFPVSLAVSEVFLRGRRIFTGILRDVTDYNSMRRQVLQAEKLAAIGEMAASIAHEIRNPLTGIRGALEVFRDSLERNDDRREVMEDVLVEVNRLNSVVNDLLDFARPWTPNLQASDLMELVNRVVESFLEEASDDDLKIAIEGPKSLEVEVDPWLFEKVLWNLLKNASDAMPRDGEIKVTAAAKGGDAEVVVTDWGSGVDVEDPETLFRPFFTRKSRGTGLGLSICRKILTAHDGEIRLEKGDEKGTRAVLRFPCRPRPHRMSP